MDSERSNSINFLKEICRKIGCSGMSEMCGTSPHLCKIIRKVVLRKEEGDVSNRE